LVKVDDIGIKICKVLDEEERIVGVFTVKTIGGGKFSRIIVRVGRVRNNLYLDGDGDRDGDGDDDTDAGTCTAVSRSFQEIHAKVNIDSVVVSVLDGMEGGARKKRKKKKKIHPSTTPNPSDGAGDLFNLPSLSSRDPYGTEEGVEVPLPPTPPSSSSSQSSSAIAMFRIIFTSLQVDYRKMFSTKSHAQNGDGSATVELNQLSTQLGSLSILDMKDESAYPVVFNAGLREAEAGGVLDLLVRWRGSDNGVAESDHGSRAFYRVVDLVRMNVLCRRGESRTRGEVSIATSEKFVTEVGEVWARMSTRMGGGGGRGNGNRNGNGDDVVKFANASSGEIVYQFRSVMVSNAKFRVTFQRKPKQQLVAHQQQEQEQR